MGAPPGGDMGAPPGGDMGAPPDQAGAQGNVTFEEASSISPDASVSQDHVVQLQTALAVLNEGIKQLRRIVDALTNQRIAGGAAPEEAPPEAPKVAYYRGVPVSGKSAAVLNLLRALNLD